MQELTRAYNIKDLFSGKTRKIKLLPSFWWLLKEETKRPALKVSWKLV